jgi:hypothetical protein
MIGPDAARYLHLGGGGRVPRPFVWRWLLPELCGTNATLWRAVWFGSWPVSAAGMFWFAHNQSGDWQRSLTAAVLLVGLSGILGPQVVNPVGVDLPATAITLVGCGFLTSDVSGHWAAALVLVTVAGCVKETSPLFAAIWVWSPLPLVGLVAPVGRWCWVRFGHLEGPDPFGAEFQAIADHPMRAGLLAHRGRWRDGWLMVAPWGVCLVALYEPSWPLVVALAVAYAQLIVATDTVRLVHHAAGPVMAIGAVGNIPNRWLLLAAVAHVFWFFRVERV